MRYETYYFSNTFAVGGLRITPVHLRLESLQPVIAAHQHSNISYEIHYSQSGTGNVVIDGTTHPVGADTLYVTGPNVIHQQNCSESDPVIEYCLYLDCEIVNRAHRGALDIFADTHFWLGQDGGRVFPLLRTLMEENRSPSVDTAEMSEALLRQVIIALSRAYRSDLKLPDAKHSASSVTRAALRPMIDDIFCYQCSNLTLSQLANMLNLSVRQTQRLLQDSYGKTFSQKLIEAKMASAAHLLSTDKLSITEISERLGFSSIEYFSTQFHRFMQISPREYRKNAMANRKM